MSELPLNKRILGGLWDAIIGDALGVPVELKSREEVRKDPVTTMGGYETFNLPPGSWSDDSSLMLCTTESLLDGFDTQRMGQLFTQWLNNAYWTPWGQTFDVGMATHAGIKRMMRGIPPEEAGGTSEGDNGNGSLMRILPVGLYFAGSSVTEIIEYASRASSLTHRHPRSQMACVFYCLMTASLLKGLGPSESYHKAIDETLTNYRNMPYSKEHLYFKRILSGTMADLPEDQIYIPADMLSIPLKRVSGASLQQTHTMKPS